MNNSILRKEIESTKTKHIKRYGKLDWQYYDEGLPYTIMKYHSSVRSVMNFTEDDWLACKENGWTLDEVCKLCNESYSYTAILAKLSKEDALALVESFYKWYLKLLPNSIWG